MQIIKEEIQILEKQCTDLDEKNKEKNKVIQNQQDQIELYNKEI